MSEEIILGGAFFDNSMPKWATEETIKKLALEFKKDRAISKKQQDSMVKLLEKMAQLSVKAEKATQDQTKELKALVKDVKASTKANADVLKELKEQTKELKKHGHATSKAGSTTGTEAVFDSSDVEDRIKDSNQWLEKIYAKMGTLGQGTSQSSSSSQGTIHPIQAHDDLNATVRREQPKDRVAALREVLERAETANNERSAGQLHGNDRIKALNQGLTQSSSKLTRMSKALTKAIGGISGFTNKLTKILSSAFTILKKIPIIGTAITAITTSIGAAMDLHNILFDSHKDYMRLLRSGFNFTKDILDETRMDGIRLRKIIAETGFTVEAAMDVMATNAALFNQIGMDAFNEASKVAGAATDSASFMNQMMMDRKDILGFTSEYLSMLVRIGDIEALNQERRTRSIEKFIRNTSDFSKITGKSLEEIKKIMSAVGEAPDENAFLTQFSVDERETKRETLQAIKALGLGDMLMSAITSAGAAQMGLFADQEKAAALQRTLATTEGGRGIFNRLNDFVKQVASGGSGVDKVDVIALVRDIRAAMGDDGLNALDGSYDLRQRMMQSDGIMREMYGVLMKLYALDSETMQKVIRGEDTTSGAVTSQEGRAIQKMEQTIEAREIAVQAAMATMADSQMGRSMLMSAVGARQRIEEQIMVASRTTADTVVDALPALKKMVGMLLDDDNDQDYEEVSEENYDKALEKKAPETSISKEFRAMLRKSGIKTDMKDSWFNGDEEAKQRESLKEKGLDPAQLMKRWTEAVGHEKDRIAQTIAFLASKQSEGITDSDIRDDYLDILTAIKEKSPDKVSFQDMVTRALSDPHTLSTVVMAQFREIQVGREHERIAREKREKQLQAQKTRTLAEAQERKQAAEREEAEFKKAGNYVKVEPQVNTQQPVDVRQVASGDLLTAVNNQIADELVESRTEMRGLLSELVELNRKQLEQSKKSSSTVGWSVQPR